ncbi:MAG: hypothetical protein K2Q32_05715 [Alphaproteobacteria bacterium]|nr:hypothetical protein [Alphaproteobacteria bacterium]
MAKKPQGGNPAARTRKQRAALAAARSNQQKSSIPASTKLANWILARTLFQGLSPANQKRVLVSLGVAAAGAVVIGGVTVRHYSLPAICYQSESPLPAKTSIFTGLFDLGNGLSASESFAFIERGLNFELKRVQDLDVGKLVNRDGLVIGHFQGLSARVEGQTSLAALPKQIRLTINGKEYDIDPGDEFKVSRSGVTIGVHSFKITDIVDFASSRDTSAAAVPDGRIFYHLIGKDRRYTCG